MVNCKQKYFYPTSILTKYVTITWFLLEMCIWLWLRRPVSFYDHKWNIVWQVTSLALTNALYSTITKIVLSHRATGPCAGNVAWSELFSHTGQNTVHVAGSQGKARIIDVSPRPTGNPYTHRHGGTDRHPKNPSTTSPMMSMKRTPVMGWSDLLL